MLTFTLSLFLGVTTATFQPKISPEVRDTLAEQDQAPVVVALFEPEIATRDLAIRRKLVSQAQARVLDSLEGTGFSLTSQWSSIFGFAGTVTSPGLGVLESHPDVRRVDLDAGGQGSLDSSKPFIGADLVTSSGYDGNGVTVAIIDSGVAKSHPAFGGRVIDEACFCRNSNSTGCCPNGETSQFGDGAAEDDHNHGSNVAGIVASEGGGGVGVGMAPKVEIVAVKVLDSNNGFSGSSQVIDGMSYIIDNHSEVDVVNMSLGTFARFSGFCDDSASFTIAFASAVNTLRDRGTMVFVSAGNSGDTSDLEAPACIDSSIAVGAVYDGDIGVRSYSACQDLTSQADQITCFSNSGTALDVLAPGAQVTSARRGSTGTTTFYGTSQAAPHVAGLAAVMMAANPGLTPDQIEAIFEATGIPITDGRNDLTFPRINALAAIETTCPTGLPEILVEPTGASVASGSPAIVTVTASGASSYQWYEGESGDTSTPVFGGQSATLEVSPTSSTRYWCRVSSGACGVNSASATVTVTSGRRRGVRRP